MIGDDLAGQNGPLFRPDFYRRVVKPRQKQLVQYIQSRTEREDLVPHLRRLPRLHPRPAGQRHRRPEPGADQRRRHGPGRAEGRVRRPAGRSGAGRSTPSTSCRSAAPDTVREHVRRNLEAFKPGGGYVFNNVHNIQAGVPPRTSWPCTTRPTNSALTITKPSSQLGKLTVVAYLTGNPALRRLTIPSTWAGAMNGHG